MSYSSSNSSNSLIHISLDVIFFNSLIFLLNLDKSDKLEEFQNLLNLLITDKDGNIFYTGDRTFKLYITIAEKACNGIPKNIITNKIFNEYRISKKNMSNQFYSLD